MFVRTVSAGNALQPRPNFSWPPLAPNLHCCVIHCAPQLISNYHCFHFLHKLCCWVVPTVPCSATKYTLLQQQHITLLALSTQPYNDTRRLLMNFYACFCVIINSASASASSIIGSDTLLCLACCTLPCTGHTLLSSSGVQQKKKHLPVLNLQRVSGSCFVPMKDIAVRL